MKRQPRQGEVYLNEDGVICLHWCGQEITAEAFEAEAPANMGAHDVKNTSSLINIMRESLQ